MRVAVLVRAHEAWEKEADARDEEGEQYSSDAGGSGAYDRDGEECGYEGGFVGIEVVEYDSGTEDAAGNKDDEGA